MKALLKKYLLGTLVMLLPLVASAQQISEYVSLEGKQFKLNGEDFYPVGVNYIVSVYYDSNSGSYFVGPDNRCADTVPNTSPEACFQDILDDFIELKNMNINSIRLIGLSFGQGHFANAPVDSLYPALVAKSNSNEFGETFIPLSAPYTEIFDLISTVLAAATQVGLKVQLLVGDKELDVPVNRAAYVAYLEAIASHFANNTTLYSYDFVNEPTWYDNSQFLGDDSYDGIYSTGTSPYPVITPNYQPNRSYDKKEVCELVESWNTAIKSNAPNHLTTIGLVGSVDTWEWDPALLNLDFLSFHIYDENNATSYSEYIEEVRREIRWLAETSRLPWIIGETAYPATNGTPTVPISLVNPTFQEQKDYAQVSMATVRDYGGSGYTWWNYKDCSQEGWGLLNFDDSPKPVVSEFAAFDPTIQGGYDNVSHNSYYNKFSGANYIGYGSVKDQDGNPIANAIIQQDNHLEFSTFSEPDGTFDLHSDYLIYKVRVTAPGASFDTDLVETYDVTLEQWKHDVNVLVINDVIYTGQSEYHQASNSITVFNTLVEGDGNQTGGSLDLRGEHIVKLNTGFYANRGSFVHIYNDIARFGCNSYDDYIKPDASNAKMAVSELENFQTSTKEGGISISPNPSSGIFTVSTTEVPIYQIEVFDNIGNKISEQSVSSERHQIDLSDMAGGVYVLRIYTREGINTEKVVLE